MRNLFVTVAIFTTLILQNGYAFVVSAVIRTSTITKLSVSMKNFRTINNMKANILLKVSPRISTKLFVQEDDSTNTKNKGARQLLGIKGASENKNIWAIRLQLCKPVTWIPLLWGVACGAAASGNYNTWNPFGPEQDLSIVAIDAAKAVSCMFLSGAHFNENFYFYINR